MKKTLIAASFASLLGTTAIAQEIGATIAAFDDNFLTVMRNGMTDHAASLDGVNLQVEDASNDLAKQIEDKSRVCFPWRCKDQLEDEKHWQRLLVPAVGD